MVVCPAPVCNIIICDPIGNATEELSGIVNVFAEALDISTTLELSDKTKVYDEVCAFVDRVITGAVKVLLVKVCVPVSETSTALEFPIVVPPGSVKVFVALSECGCEAIYCP